MAPDDDALHRLAEYLAELTLERREDRARKAETARKEDASQSPWSLFWTWLGANVTSVSLIATIISGGVAGWWTFEQYLSQQETEIAQREAQADFERRRTIATFAADLSDPQKRNGAAYALATLSGSVATPLLIQHFQGAARSETDAPFRDALAQALIALGPSVIGDIVRMNREADVEKGFLKSPLILATQPVLVHFLRVRAQPLFEATARLVGVTLIRADFSGNNLDDVNLSQVRAAGMNFCGTSLKRARAEKATFIEGGQFMGSSLAGAVFVDASFENANFDRVDLRDSDLTNTTFGQSTFRGATLTKARLVGASLGEATLDDADLSGADLDQAQITPRERFGQGTSVARTNFNGARNVSDDVRRYLCRNGALNVPGGCQGIEAVVLPKSSGAGGSCW